MSQEIVYGLLEELGGKATTKQISELARNKYPRYSLHAYVHVRLKSLQKWGYVARSPDGTWLITKVQPPWKMNTSSSEEATE